MKNSRFFGFLSLAGGVTAVPLLVAFLIIDGGAVGTAGYQTYELLNRLMAFTLLFMAAGWVGAWQIMIGYGRWAALFAFIGVLVMAAGTAAEFWLYTGLSYQGNNMRQVAYSTTSIGGWLLNLGAMGLGSAIWRFHIWPRWSAIIFLLALLIDIAAFILFNSPFMAVTLFALIIGLLLLKNRQQSMIESETTTLAVE